MTDKEKIINGLECCFYVQSGWKDAVWVCPACPYAKNDGQPCETLAPLLDDALTLLKKQEPITGDTSDGYHTFNELYHHRAVLFSVIVANYPDRAWKSKKHHDGTMYDGMFIVGIDTPDGQATYHYDIEPYWDMFQCRVLDNAPEWDGHTPAQAIERIGKLKVQTPRVLTLEEVITSEFGQTIWLESYFDGTTSLEAFLVDIECSNKPVLVNGRYEFYNLNTKELDEEILSTFHEKYKIKKYRFWSAKPTKEQREVMKWDDNNSNYNRYSVCYIYHCDD